MAVQPRGGRCWPAAKGRGRPDGARQCSAVLGAAPIPRGCQRCRPRGGRHRAQLKGTLLGSQASTGYKPGAGAQVSLLNASHSARASQQGLPRTPSSLGSSMNMATGERSSRPHETPRNKLLGSDVKARHTQDDRPHRGAGSAPHTRWLFPPRGRKPLFPEAPRSRWRRPRTVPGRGQAAAAHARGGAGPRRSD